MAKNIKTIRLSDEMMELIEQQAGENFTAKFEALVTKCIWEIPHQERELELLQVQINYHKKRLKEIKETADKYQRTFDNMKWSMETIERNISNITEQCNTN